MKNKCFKIVFLLILFVYVFIRVRLFLYNPSLYMDEANLARSVIHCSYLELLKPLPRLQVAPPVFLIISKIIYAIFNPKTPYYSDMALKIVPFISGVVSLPLFWLLCFKVYKNRNIALLGMLILGAYPTAISFSAIFKQYSFEALCTIIIFLITLSINFSKSSIYKNCFKFLLLGLMPAFSLSSFWILPFCFIYLLYIAFKKGEVKRLLLFSLITITCIGIYYLTFLKYIIAVHYAPMIDYWGKKVAFCRYNDIFFVYVYNLIWGNF